MINIGLLTAPIETKPIKEESVLETRIKTPTRQPKLLDRVRAAVRVRPTSYGTEKTCVHRIRKFVFFNGLHYPDEMGEKEITNFLSRLTIKKNVFIWRLSLQGRSKEPVEDGTRPENTGNFLTG
jgi:hypothetical protein